MSTHKKNLEKLRIYLEKQKNEKLEQHKKSIKGVQRGSPAR